MDEAKRPTPGEKRAAGLKRRFGDAPLDLCVFPLVEVAIRPPRSPDDFPARWKLETALGTIDCQERGELRCLLCDGLITVELPPIAGFLKRADRDSDLCCFSVCEACSRAAETLAELTALVAEAFGGTAAPPPLHSTVSGSVVLRRFCAGARRAALRRPKRGGHPR
jgi:hypothetical protein